MSIVLTFVEVLLEIVLPGLDKSTLRLSSSAVGLKVKKSLGRDLVVTYPVKLRQHVGIIFVVFVGSTVRFPDAELNKSPCIATYMIKCSAAVGHAPHLRLQNHCALLVGCGAEHMLH